MVKIKWGNAPKKTATGAGRVRTLVGLFKRPPVMVVVICVFLVLILLLTLFLGLRSISSRIERYNKTISYLADSFSGINKEIDVRTARLSSAELLLNNTNRILSTVYFGTADLEEREEFKDFTAFTLIFEEKYYLITAGHCIEFEDEKYSNFKFKANNKSYWVMPDLITFENDYDNNNDYAIFYSNNLFNMGLIPASENEDMTPQYILGNTERDLNLVKRYSDAIKGESGSPVLNKKCHVIGVLITKDGKYTPVSTVLKVLAEVEASIK